MSKHLFTAVLTVLALLTACGAKAENAPAEAVSESAPKPQSESAAKEEAQDIVPAAKALSLTIYYPDELYEYLLQKTVAVDEITPDALIAQLTEAGVLEAGVTVNELKQEKNGGSLRLHLDLSSDFMVQLNKMGTSGEYYLMGSVVNTFLSTYEASDIIITVEGEPPETGHQIYEGPQILYDPGPDAILRETLSIEGEPETVELLKIYNPLGFTISYDYDRFQYDTDDGMASFMLKDKPEHTPAAYITISLSDMTAADTAEGLLHQGNGDAASEEAAVFGFGSYEASCITRSANKEADVIQRFYVTEQEDKVWLVELGFTPEMEETMLPRMEMMLHTLRFVK